MQNFKLNKVALAVGATLLATAGVAQAVVVAPAGRAQAANPAVITALGFGATASQLVSTGVTAAGTIIDITLTAPAPTGIVNGAVATAALAGSTTVTIAIAPTVLPLSATAGVLLGMTVTGPNVPAGSVVTAVVNNTSVTITYPTAPVGSLAIAAGAALTFANAPAATALANASGGITTPAFGVANVNTGVPATSLLNAYVGTTATVVPVTAAALTGATTNGVNTLRITLGAPTAVTGATPRAAFRASPLGIAGAAGLEYSADTNLNVWAPVKIDLAANAAWTNGGTPSATLVTANGDVGLAAAPGLLVSNGVAPTPTYATQSQIAALGAAANGALVNGFVIDTGAPVAAITAANLLVKASATGSTFPAAAITAAPVVTAATASATTAITTHKIAFTFPRLDLIASGADFVTSVPAGTIDAADTAFYNATNFNTGIIGAIAFTVDEASAVFATGAAITTAVTPTVAGVVTVTAANTVAAGDRVTGFGLPAGTVVAAGPTATAFTFAIPAGSAYVAGAVQVDRPIAYTTVFDAATGAAKTLGSSTTTSLADAAKFFPALPFADRAQPILLSASYSTPITTATASVAGAPFASANTGAGVGTTTLTLNFSESMSPILSNAASDTAREILENILIGGNSLAALSLNNGVLAAPAIAAGSTWTIAGVPVGLGGIVSSATVPTALTLNAGITLQEPNDTGYVVGTNQFDNISGTSTLGTTSNNGTVLGNGTSQLSGGILATTSAPLAGVATTVQPYELVATPAATLGATLVDTILFGGADVTATAQTSLTDSTKIATITLKFNKNVKLNPGTTAIPAAALLADLAKNLVVNVSGHLKNSTGATFTPTTFQLPASSPGVVLTPTLAGVAATTGDFDTLTIALPLPLIYTKIATITGLGVDYLNGSTPAGTAWPAAYQNTLVAAGTLAAAATPVNVAAGSTTVAALPLTATLSQNQLYTQSISGTVNNAATGSRIKAYLARFEPAAVVAAPVTTTASTIVSGQMSNPADAVSTWLAINFVTKPALTAKIDAELNKAAPAVAALIPVWADYQRNNTGAGASGTGVASGAAAGVAGTAGNANNTGNITAKVDLYDVDPGAAVKGVSYFMWLNPTTGVLSGTLNGLVTTSRKTSTVTSTAAATTNAGFSFIDPASGKKTTGAGGPVAVGNTANAYIAGSNPAMLVAGETTVSANGTYKIDLGLDANNNVNTDWANSYVLLVLEQPGAAAGQQYTLLTSADSGAANYLPFTPQIVNAGTARTAAPVVDVNNIQRATLPGNAYWSLLPLGDMSRNAAGAVPVTAATVPGLMVGLDTATGVPTATWTDVTAATDRNATTAAARGPMALTLAYGVTNVITKPVNGDTIATPVPTALSTVGGSAAIAVSTGGTAAQLNVLDRTAVSLPLVATANAATGAAVGVAQLPVFLNPGWSLVRVPASGVINTTATGVTAVIKVGAGVNSTSWFAADLPALPAVNAGDAVFVYAPVAGTL